MVSVLVLIATEIFIHNIKWMEVQEIFQGTFKLISILGQVLYLSRQTTEHLDHRIVCSFWYADKLDIGWCRFDLVLVLMSYISELP
jgi:hypothetical protein